MNKLRWSTAYIGLEQYDSGDVVTVVLSREDGFIIGLVLDEYKKRVVWPSYGLRFRGGIQLKFNLECAVNIL